MSWNAKLNKMAKILVNYSVEVGKGDEVVIRGPAQSQSLIQELYKEVLKAGGHPQILASPEDKDFLFFNYASEEQITHKPKLLQLIAQEYDAVINIKAEYNTKALSNINSKKMAQRQNATRDITSTFMDRAAQGELNWVLAQFPTHASAQDAEMSLTEYRNFLIKACKLDRENPEQEWSEIHKFQKELVDKLDKISQITVKSKDTDLTLSTKGRSWINCSGKENYPDGEVFTAPVEDSVQGHIRFSFPGVYQGKAIEDIKLEFEDGLVMGSSAKRGQQLLENLLQTDSGAKRLGEFGIGTNYGITQFTRNMLFDEKMGGTIHLALGRGYPESGSENESGLHWDMLCDMKDGGEIMGDGELIYKDGEFVK